MNTCAGWALNQRNPMRRRAARRAEDRELAGAGEVEEVGARREDPPAEVAEERKGARRDGGESGSEPSSPSVRLTALLLPVITVVTKAT
ncbi:MAG: hypothetical protein U0133_04670 [Gemmatimonadales bacterium]